MDLIVSVLMAAAVNIWFCVIKIFYPKRFVVKFPIRARDVPTVRIRENGTISWKRPKYRSGLSVFADGGSIKIEDCVFFNRNCSINAKLSIKIGAGTLFGENVVVYDHDHYFDLKNGVDPKNFKLSEVQIGSNCWIGSGCVILKGSIIENNVLVGAGATVRGRLKGPGVYVSDGAKLRKVR